MQVSVKNTFVAGFVDEDEESEDEKKSLKRSSSEGELSKHSSKYGSSESSFLFWMPPPEIAELGSESSSFGGADSSSDNSAQRRASASQGVPATLQMRPSTELAENSRLQARRTSPAFVETSISAIHQAVRGCPGWGQIAEGYSSGSQSGPAVHAGQGLQAAATPWISAAPASGLEPVMPGPPEDDIVAKYQKETGMAVSDLEGLYQSGTLQLIPRNVEGGFVFCWQLEACRSNMRPVHLLVPRHLHQKFAVHVLPLQTPGSKGKAPQTKQEDTTAHQRCKISRTGCRK